MSICAVYILASHRHGTLYVGYTTDLAARLYQHKSRINPLSFSAQYDVCLLVYYEEMSDAHAAYLREQKLKGSSRAKKIRLIEKTNPGWKDLYAEML